MTDRLKFVTLSVNENCIRITLWNVNLIFNFYINKICTYLANHRQIPFHEKYTAAPCENDQKQIMYSVCNASLRFLFSLHYLLGGRPLNVYCPLHMGHLQLLNGRARMYVENLVVQIFQRRPMFLAVGLS